MAEGSGDQKKCDLYWIFGARARILKDTRTVRAVSQLRDECFDKSNSAIWPTDPRDAASVVAAAFAQVSQSPPKIKYDDMEQLPKDCPLFANLQPHRPETDDADVMIRVHFARQMLRYANATKHYIMYELWRNSDDWHTIRLALSIYGDLKRLGYSKAYQQQSETIVDTARGVDNAFRDVYDTFIRLNGGLVINFNFVPLGFGIVEGLLTQLEQADVNLISAMQEMASRLPGPPQGSPQFSIAKYRAPCVNCSEVTSGTGETPIPNVGFGDGTIKTQAKPPGEAVAPQLMRDVSGPALDDAAWNQTNSDHF